MSCAFGPGVGRGSAAGLHHPASPRRLRGAAPSDAQRAAVRRAVRRLQDQELIEVQRRGVGRTYRRRRAYPHRTYPRYERQLAVCPGPEQGCAGCAPATWRAATSTARLRATARARRWFPVEQPRPETDYRTYEVEITGLCARRAP
ncbi:hypothetical protein [Streptomyces sp. WAC 06725]|uniref:hypothetical protein n=1 Tax=Streptomyces sp. WAC 06725 TaxID=2203209 RepID=UPI000F74BE95|nr:hypothetical protein [Streptomyces sp. WAC 06725]